MTDAVSPELARRIGVMSADVPDAEPQTMLDWALHYAAREFFVFPAEPHLGRSYVKNWYNDATLDPKTIKEWFAKIDDDVDWYNADIGAVPDKSGHYVLSAHYDEGGIESLDELIAEFGPLPAEFDYLDRWGSRFLWLKGCAYTSHHRIGEGLHVLGAGHCVFLPPSYTPHRNFAKRG